MMEWLKRWEHLKTFLSTELDVDHPMLHVHAGLALWVLAKVLLRRSPGSLLPLLAVTGAEAVNEVFDFGYYYLSHWPWTAEVTIRDVVDTLLWPVVLTIVERMRHAAFPTQINAVAAGTP